jgi:hypothetical protein
MHPHYLQRVLSFYFAKGIKIIMVTNSIKSVDVRRNGTVGNLNGLSEMRG